MIWLALKMLVGDRTKYFVIVFGVALASTMMAHQLSTFYGVMERTINQIRDVHPLGVWVMDPAAQYLDEVKPISQASLYRVRGTLGVAWAAPLFKNMVRAQTSQGRHRQVILLGVDDISLAGAPQRMLLGSVAHLRQPDALIVDEAGYSYLWPGEEMRLGRTLEINEHRAVLVGVCDVSRPFQTLPIMYTRFHNAVRYHPGERNSLSFVLVSPRPGVSPKQLCKRIQNQTGLLALSAEEFSWRTLVYYAYYTGIPVNFAIVVSLGFVVGVAIAGQNFYLFTVENLNSFGILKAMGVNRASLIRMIILQATVVGMLGYGIGMGLAALVIEVATRVSIHLAGFFLSWEVVIATGISVIVIMVLTSVISIRRVLLLEPAVVFRV